MKLSNLTNENFLFSNRYEILKKTWNFDTIKYWNRHLKVSIDILYIPYIYIYLLIPENEIYNILEIQ